MARSSQGIFSSPWFLPNARQTILSGATAESKNNKKKKKRKSRTFGHLGQRAWGGIELDEEDEDEQDDEEENEADDGLGGGGGDPFSTSHHDTSTINRGLFSYGQTPGMGFDKEISIFFFYIFASFVRQMATSCSGCLL